MNRTSSKPGIAGRGHRRHRRNSRRLAASAPRPAVTILSTEIGPLTDRELMITFDTGVAVVGVPQWALNTGRLPTAKRLESPNVLVLTYGETPIDGVSFTVPAKDVSVRGVTGGAVTPGDYLTEFSGVAALPSMASPTPAPAETAKKAA